MNGMTLLRNRRGERQFIHLKAAISLRYPIVQYFVPSPLRPLNVVAIE